ncbi:aminoacyl-tRNA hydrolase [Candidatus Bipolaricaulota bacterium]|nr:aminoacyl-tRNA hydrolase [Candidatus Bipolaricaulota bacterium]
MRAVIGLGNPGLNYAPTRHNAGFWVLARLLGRARWRKQQFPWGEVYRAEDGLLLRPLTFMNRAGEAVREFLHLYPLSPPDLLIVYDDVDLPVGELRLRGSGGAGTHNGMRSVLAALGSEEVPRLRIGVGAPPPGMELSQYVLSPPSQEELPLLSAAADRAAELAWVFLRDGLQAALDEYSRQGRV